MCNESYFVVYGCGDKFYYKNGTKTIERIYHRTDGPAIESYNGAKYWYINGVRHRHNGPAVETSVGSKYWYFNGELHREDGPAIFFSYGKEYFYLKNKPFSKKQYYRLIKLKAYL